jgi:cell division protein FtsW
MTRRVDRLLFLSVLLIALVGLIALFSASAVISDLEMKDPFYYVNRQLLWTIVGLSAFLTVIFLPVSLIEKLTVPGMMIALLGLLLVFVPGAGKSVSSSKESFHRWVEIGPLSFQPSEFAKVALILYSAWLLNRYQNTGDLRQMMIRGIPVPVALVLIILEPQYGTTLTLIAVLACLVFVTGFPVMRLIGILVASLPLLFLLAYLWEYRLERLRVWLDPYSYRYEAGYQLVMSFRAFREGWWFGTDLASGVAHRYLTFGHTDFILALFYEDFGFLGLTGLVLLYGFYCFHAIRLIAQQPEDFASLSAAGCVILFGLQSLINMFVVTGVLPTTGISLPFMSYGGSSLVVQYILAGLVLNFTSHNRHRVVLPVTGGKA